MSEAAHRVSIRAVHDTVVLGHPTRGSLAAEMALTVDAEDAAG